MARVESENTPCKVVFDLTNVDSSENKAGMWRIKLSSGTHQGVRNELVVNGNDLPVFIIEK